MAGAASTTSTPWEISVELHFAIDLLSIDAERLRSFRARETRQLGEDAFQRVTTLLLWSFIGEQAEILAT